VSSLPIAPDESTGEPRCVATCPSATPSTCGGVCCSECVDCEVDQVSTEVGLLCLPRVRELVALAGRVSEALDVALCCGGIDGGHHKAWVIDQMVRHLAGDGYAAWVAVARDGEDGPETYYWDEGIAP
jgi:hypothetical protein